MLSIFVCSFLRYTNVFIFKVYQFVPLFNKCTPELNYSSSQSISLHNLNMADTAVQYRRSFKSHLKGRYLWGILLRGSVAVRTGSSLRLSNILPSTRTIMP